MVLDRELIVTDKHGGPDFEKVMKRLQTRDPLKVQQLFHSLPVQYVVFETFITMGVP
jgi:DNA ligase 1